MYVCMCYVCVLYLSSSSLMGRLSLHPLQMFFQFDPIRGLVEALIARYDVVGDESLQPALHLLILSTQILLVFQQLEKLREGRNYLATQKRRKLVGVGCCVGGGTLTSGT